MFLIKDIKF